jgi:hypothetical protein
VGRLIPAGTGMPTNREILLEKDEAAPQRTLDDCCSATKKKRCRWPTSTTSSKPQQKAVHEGAPQGRPFS